VQKESFPILLNIDAFKTHLNCFEQAWYQLSWSLDILETATVGHQDSATGDFLDKICDATPNSHGFAIFIKTPLTHHTAFRHNDDH
jgi:hypothetical protein